MRTDDLHALFAELRRLKMEELPAAEKMGPVMNALYTQKAHEDIRRIERKIEREMNGG